MVIIFSNRKVDGLEGTYANPSLFNGDFGGATLVITKHDHIKEAALEQEIKVRGFEGKTIEAPTKVVEEPILKPLTDKVVTSIPKPKRKPRVKKAE